MNRFSVIIPVKEDAPGLAMTLNSLPDCPDLEVIVIDAGNDDATLGVILNNEHEIDHWDSGNDTGIANAFNRGIRLATGEMIAILNAGDCWFGDTLANVKAAMSTSPDADVVHGTIEYVDASGVNKYRVTPDVSRLRERMYVFHPTMFVKASCYAAVGTYNENYLFAMDSEWCHRAVSAGCKFIEVKAPLACMALGGRSDVNYGAALREYRRSVIENGLAPPWLANIHYLRILIAKWLKRSMIVRWVRVGRISEPKPAQDQDRSSANQNHL